MKTFIIIPAPACITLEVLTLCCSRSAVNLGPLIEPVLPEPWIIGSTIISYHCLVHAPAHPCSHGEDNGGLVLILPMTGNVTLGPFSSLFERQLLYRRGPGGWVNSSDGKMLAL